MTMVRGSNPIWYEVDLTAHAFDDTFYLFVLNNEIPYQPLPVWQDPFGNVVWDNPIRFLANGTLPNNIYYDPDTVYRLEFRQGPTQADPLIYLVENYVPGSSGDTPIDDTSFSTDNQITNPQFALINFTSPLVLNSVSSQVIKVATGWFLHLTGTGNVTLTQVLINSSVQNPTNASYALKIELSGSWTNAYLAQRFEQNGVLWANTFVSSAVMALSGNAPQNISAKLVDSQGATLASVLPTTPLTEVFNEYPGVGELPASTNTDFPPGAYIEYQLQLPNNCNITVSSFQLISGDIEVTYPYEQDTIQRQIDQTYHDAYPIIPIGGIMPFWGFGAVAHYFDCDGTAISRQTYNLLFNKVTTVETVTLTSGLATITVANGALYAASHPIEGVGIQAGTTIVSISGNVVTMSATATANGPSALRFFSVGNGDGSTTFNVPYLIDSVLAQAFGTLLPTKGVGSAGGAATHAITINEMPAHNHPGSTVGSNSTANGGSVTNYGAFQAPNQNFAVNIASQGGGQAMSLVQPTRLVRYMIRYE